MPTLPNTTPLYPAETLYPADTVYPSDYYQGKPKDGIVVVENLTGVVVVEPHTGIEDDLQ